MGEVVLDGEDPNGLAQMVAGLIEANVAADPGKERLLATMRGAVQLDVPDAGVTVGLKFIPGVVTVTSTAVPGADVRIRADADTVLGLSTVPLRLGLPDLLTEEGRRVAKKLLTGRLRIGGLPLGLQKMRKLNRLLNIAS
jgi:hypothetical protein